MVVLPYSQVKASVMLGRSTVTVPYTLSGRYVLQSGTRVAGNMTGTYAGVNSHDMSVLLEGSSTAQRSIQQEAPSITKTSSLSTPASLTVYWPTSSDA